MIFNSRTLLYSYACSEGLDRFNEWAGDDNVTIDQLIENHIGYIGHTTDLIWFLLRIVHCPAMQIARGLFACFGPQGLPDRYALDSPVFIDRIAEYPITTLNALIHYLVEAHGAAVVVTKAHTVLASLLKEYGQQS